MGLLVAEQLWAASHLVGGQLYAIPDTETYTRDPLPANSDDVGRAFRLIYGIPLLSAGYRTMTAMVEGSCVHTGITNGRFRRIGDNGAPDWERSPSTSPAPDKPRLQAAEPRSRNNWGRPTKF